MKQRQGQPGAGLFLLLTPVQWNYAFVWGLVVSVVLYPWYKQVSPWIGGGVLLTGVTLVHLRYACRYVLPFPHIMLLMAALQLVFAAWVSVAYPAEDPTYDISGNAAAYFEYAVPVLLSTAIGLGLGFGKMTPPATPVRINSNSGVLFVFDVLIVVGFIGILLTQLTRGGNFGFALVLVANLRYIGAFGRMLTREAGWAWRVGGVLAAEVLFASSSGMFHVLILWVVWTFALCFLIYRPSLRILMLSGAAAILLLPALQEAKWQLRGAHDVAVNTEQRISFAKAKLWLIFLGKSVVKTATGGLGNDFIADTAVRYNQGWIINRVLLHVPAGEPHAYGETIKDALYAAVVPRFLDPDKPIAGGQVNFQRYTGLPINEGTSMNLGFAGELYANFGYWGGIASCGLYAFCLAWLFHAVCVRAFRAPLWWAVLPYIAFSAMKSEEGIVDVLNWVVKACVFLGIVCVASPAFRHELFPNRSGLMRKK